MRRFVSLLPALALLPAALFAQGVNVNGAATPLHDTRPFGKYLVQVCTLSYGGSLECPATFPETTPQAITLKQTACVLNSGKCPEPDYPLPNGATITIRATSDSGLKVTQHVVSGDVTPRDGIGIQQYVVNGTGTIVIRATQIGNSEYAAAAPVDLILTVASDQSDKTESGRSCSGLFAAPAPTVTEPQVDLPAILGLIGTPTPFVLAAQGKHTILIYSTRYPLNPDEKAVLSTIPSSIAELARRTVDSLGIPASSKPFKVELAIPHAAALGDLAGRISGLNYSQFTMQNIGSDRVRISASSQPDCPTWKAFLSAVRHLEWQVTPEPFDMKLYYLAATDAATAFTTLAGGAGATTAPSTPPASAAPAATAGQGSSSATTGAATIALNQPPGSLVEIKSDTTPCVVAGLALGNSSACAPASGTGGASSSGGSAPTASSGGGSAAPKPPAMAAMGVAAGVGVQTPSDLLVFSDTNPGDDAQITERKRILAQLDLPRPEMIINAWVMQNSSTNPRAMGAFSNTVRHLVAGYNDALEEVVLSGWKFVKDRTKKPDYFDWDFYHYISDYYVADTYRESKLAPPEEAAQRFLDTSPAKLADSPETRTKDFGICPENRYCLGYNALFQPLKPRLTDFLLTLIAAADPPKETVTAIEKVEGDRHPVADQSECKELASELRDRCRAIWNNLGLDREPRPAKAPPSQPPVEPSQPPVEPSCAVTDYMDILGSLVYADSDAATDKRPHPRIYLTCFREAANKYLTEPAEPGLLRAAIADFLFNYKISQQYPHEFAPYDLSQSADGLNAALSPLIDAFNRDIVAFQAFMRADVQYQVERLNNDHDQRCCVKRLFGLDKPSFFNDGLVTVRTISGQQAVVNTTSQSSLDASSAPTLSALLNSMNTPGGGSGSGASPLAGVLGSSPNSVALLAGVLNAYQTTRVQIGRQLNLTVVPRSLSTASSAEISVVLNADETSGGPAFTGGPAGGAAPNTSRVANHDITTRVRVESVKLFELSSFSAIIQRSRSKFPLLPPFVEIPYIGTIAGIPIPGAKEYHSSTAVLSAMVVPTAADIAYGLRFLHDRVVDGDPGPCSYLTGSAGPGAVKPCRFRRAVSIHDLNNPIRNFHKFMITCLATDMMSPYSSSASLKSTDTAACKNLSFDKVPHDAF